MRKRLIVALVAVVGRALLPWRSTVRRPVRWLQTILSSPMVDGDKLTEKRTSENTGPSGTADHRLARIDARHSDGWKIPRGYLECPPLIHGRTQSR